MKDTITLGSIAGAVGGAVGLIFSYSMYSLGVSPMSSINLAASLVTLDVMNLSSGGTVFAIITHFAVAASYGVLLTYVIKVTGKDFWLFKGIALGALFCLVAHSYLIPLMRTDAQVRSAIFNPPSFGTMLTTHIIIGMVTAFIIVKYYCFEKS